MSDTLYTIFISLVLLWNVFVFGYIGFRKLEDWKSRAYDEGLHEGFHRGYQRGLEDAKWLREHVSAATSRADKGAER